MNASNRERFYLTPSLNEGFPGFTENLPRPTQSTEFSEIDVSQSGTTTRRVYTRVEESVIYRPAPVASMPVYRHKPKDSMFKGFWKLLLVIGIVWFAILTG